MGCCSTGGGAVLTAEIKDVILQSPFLAITTVSREGKPHLVVVRKVKEIRDENTLVFGVYKMVKTRQNLAETGFMQVAAVTDNVGYRLSGKACAKDDEVLFKVETAEALL